MSDRNEPPMTFREVIAHAANQQANKYVDLMMENGYTGPDAERFRRVVARIFVDAVIWTMAGDLHITASNLIDLDQIEAVVEVHHELSAILYAAGVRSGNNTPEGDRAGQDDQGTSQEV